MLGRGGNGAFWGGRVVRPGKGAARIRHVLRWGGRLALRLAQAEL